MSFVSVYPEVHFQFLLTEDENFHLFFDFPAFILFLSDVSLLQF